MNYITIDGNTLKYFKENEVPQDETFLIQAYVKAKQIANLLNIECPYLTYSSGLCCLDPLTGVTNILSGITYLKSDITELDNNLIVLSIADFTENQLLGTLAHEMRHIWQEKFMPDISTKPARGYEMITAPAEIDADGYAIWFLACELNISIEDAAAIMCPQEQTDYRKYFNARIEKAKELQSIHSHAFSNRTSSIFNSIKRLFNLFVRNAK